MPVIFRVKLGKTGNSLKITVPRPIVEGFGWNEGDEIVLITSEEEIVLRKSPRSEKRPEAASKGDLSEND
jgi:AbrB family looped-hinge helix DNA binding protein